jgi:ABC-type nickel/cobalt efflux system permease component RcnA
MKYLFILLAALMVACQPKPKEESAAMKEAREVHQRMTEVASATKNLIEAEIARVQPKIQPFIDAGDTLMAEKMQAIAGKLAELRDKLQAWEKNVVAVPGEDAHDHAHGEGHDHSHASNPTEGMSDDQVLEIQKSLEEEINTLSMSLTELQNEVANADTTQTQP